MTPAKFGLVNPFWVEMHYEPRDYLSFGLDGFRAINRLACFGVFVQSL